MADDWEMANLEQAVSDLEYERDEYRDLLVEARNLIAEMSHHIEDHPALDRRVEEFLRRMPR